MANNSTVTALKSVFIGLGCLMVATLIYTISIDGSPFRKDLLTPWMIATLVDFYINVIILAAWVCYRESSWLAAVLWIILLVCLGSAATCLYIAIKLHMLSVDESSHDPIYHLLLQPQKRNAVHKKGAFQLTAARVIFSLLGCLMLGVLVYTTSNYGSPFHKELLTPWMIATLIDFYINVTALSVWISYRESSWLTAFAWIVLLICCGSIATCAYVVWQFLLLSHHDPLYLVLLKGGHRDQTMEITVTVTEQCTSEPPLNPERRASIGPIGALSCSGQHMQKKGTPRKITPDNHVKNCSRIPKFSLISIDGMACAA